MTGGPPPGEKPFSRAWHRRQDRITVHGANQDERGLLALLLGLLLGGGATANALANLFTGRVLAGLLAAAAACCLLLGARALWRSGRELPDHRIGEPLSPQWWDSSRSLLVCVLLVGVGMVLLALSAVAA